VSRPAVVQLGASAVRVARAGPDGAVRVVEAAADPAVPLHALLTGLVDDGAPVRLLGDPAVAVAGAADAVVLDAGHAGSVVARVRGGAVVRRLAGPGGARLDAAVAALLVRARPGWAGRPELPAEARRVREALSLLPGADAVLPGSAPLPVAAEEARTVLAEPLGELVRAVAALAGPDPVPVHVVGGVARTPLLAELLDAAGLPDVRVAPRPDVAALLAAVDAAAYLPGAGGLPGGAGGLPADAGPRLPAGAGPWLPAVPSPGRRRARAGALVVAGALLVGVLHLAGGLLAAAPADPGAGPAGVLAQYDHRFRLPDGWVHTGGLPERRRSLLTPRGAPEGSDLIVVESTPLGYDAGAEPGRAAAELRAVYDDAVARGAALSGYDDAARFGGRAVTTYREDAATTTVRWYVLLDGTAQLSVGCRRTPSGGAAVDAACAVVVGSLEAT
jgi:type VII secretion-associated protein (TIGR03931 family)